MADENAVIQRIESRLDQQIDKLNKSKTVTIGIYIVLIVIVIGYLSFLSAQIKEFSTPEAVAEITTGYVIKYLPEGRKDVAKQIKGNADEVMNEFLDSGLEKIPKLRMKIEQTAMAEIRTQLRLGEQGLNEFLDYAYKNEAYKIRPYVQELNAAQTMEEIENILYGMLKEPFDNQEFRMELETYGIALQQLAERLQYLRETKDLSETEKLEKEIITVLHEISKRAG